MTSIEPTAAVAATVTAVAVTAVALAAPAEISADVADTTTTSTNIGGMAESSIAGGGSAKGSLAEQNISYSAERIIGNGSFGVVFEAKVVETGEVVAIKKVLQDKRFKNRELQIMRQLVKDPHPNIVALKHCFYSQVRIRFACRRCALLYENIFLARRIH